MFGNGDNRSEWNRGAGGACYPTPSTPHENYRRMRFLNIVEAGKAKCMLR